MQDKLKWVPLFVVGNGLFFCLLGLPYLQKILAADTFFATTLISNLSVADKARVIAFSYLNYLCYMGLLAVIPGCIVAISGGLLRKPGLQCILAITIMALAALLLVIDQNVFSLYHIHLNFVLLEMVFSQQMVTVFDFSAAELQTFTLIILSLIGCECLLLRLALTYHRKCAAWVKRAYLGWLIGLVLCYLMLFGTLDRYRNLLLQQIANLPLYSEIIRQLAPLKNSYQELYRLSEGHFLQPDTSHHRLNYPRNPLRCKKPTLPFNIVLIAVDSLRFDSLTPRLMPNVYRFSETALRFDQHYSGGNATQPGLFSLFYGIPGNYFTAARKQHKPPVLSQLLQQYQYRFKIIWSTTMASPPMDKTVYLGIKNLNRLPQPGDTVPERDRQVTKQALTFINKQTVASGPFFLNVFYDAPHAFCAIDKLAEIYPTGIRQCNRLRLDQTSSPLPFYNRYRNSVHFVDGEVEQILQALQQKGLTKRSIIIITSDHGQEFNDTQQNYWGHGSNYSSFQTRTPLIISWPGRAASVYRHLTTHYDLSATLLEQYFHCTNPADDYSIGHSLFDSDVKREFILASSYANNGLITPERLIVLQASGEITFQSLNAKRVANHGRYVSLIKQALALMHHYYAKT